MNKSIPTTNIVISKSGFFDSLISFEGHNSEDAKDYYFELFTASISWEPEEEEFEDLLEEGYFENEEGDRIELHNSVTDLTS
jgi:hypothetical protein